MQFIDTIKKLEHAEFIRRQVKAQVRAMTQTMNDLMTKRDGKHWDDKIDSNFKKLSDKMDYKFDLLAAEIRNLSKTTDIRFEAIYKELRIKKIRP